MFFVAKVEKLRDVGINGRVGIPRLAIAKSILRIIPQRLSRESESGRIRQEARIERLGEKTETLWFEWTPEDAPELWPTHAHPFLLVMLFSAMSKGMDIQVEGPVCPSLLENLEWMMEIWQFWMPNLYRRIKIEAQPYVEPAINMESRTAVHLFSGELDSCRSLYFQCASGTTRFTET